MYHHPSSSSSSQQNPMGPTTAAGVGGSGGLTRYVSAPGSLLRTAVDSIIGSSSSSPSPSQPSIVSSSHSHQHHHYFAGGSTTTAGGDSSPVSSFTTTESTCKVNSSNAPGNNTKSGLQRSYGLNEIPQTHAASSSSSLLRQRSSPAGFLSHFASENGTVSFLKKYFFYRLMKRAGFRGSFDFSLSRELYWRLPIFKVILYL